MKQRAAFCFSVLISLIADAQTINLGGVVSNNTNQPIANAIVTLARQAMKDTTGTDGKYAFAATVAVKSPELLTQTEKISIINGVLQFTLNNSLPVKVNIFDIKGNLLKKEVVKSAKTGIYRFNIAKNCQATNLLIIKAAIGKREVSFSYMTLNSSKYAPNLSGAHTSPIDSGLALMAAVIDTLKVTATGYLPKAVTINSYDNQQQNITLEFSPSWPVIMSAVMSDYNADLVPDTLTITLSDTFKTEQRLDSVLIAKSGLLIVIPGSIVRIQEKQLSVQVPVSVGIDGRPSGTATICMTIGSETKSHSRAFTDGVCPALIAADVFENDGTQPDVLILSFSEPVVVSSIIGRQFLLIKAGTADTVALTVTKVMAGTNDSTYTVQMVASDHKVVAGDRLRLLPGSDGGSVADGANNKPHDLNRSVIVGFRVGATAWYLNVNTARDSQPGPYTF